MFRQLRKERASNAESLMANSDPTFTNATALSGKRAFYGHYLLVVAGLGGLLYGVDVGIIGGALPYLEATSHLNAGQLSIIVAAVLLGSVISTLVAGMLADWMGRKPLMTLSGLIFVLSIPIIALSDGYGPLFFGRLLQGASAGLIGVVAPLYLAECLPASTRGKGTGVFQWLLTLGLVAAAVIGIYYSYRVAAVATNADAATVFAFKNQAWRRIFWFSLPPGVLFVIGSAFLSESPRWLFRRGDKSRAYIALLRSRTPEQAELELKEMEKVTFASQARSRTLSGQVKDSLLSRRYLFPFLLACAILAFTQMTGVGSIIAYNTDILLQGGLSDVGAHWGYVIFTCVKFLLTIVGVALVDRSGRKFLFKLGTTGIVVSLVGIGVLFLKAERVSFDCSDAVRSMIKQDQTLTVHFDKHEAAKLLADTGHADGRIDTGRASLQIIYSYGGFTAATNFVRSNETGAAVIQITRETCVPPNKMSAFFSNPFARLEAARYAPLEIRRAAIAPVPGTGHGWLLAIGLYLFAAFFSLGPGVCVWLALSELMPTRIRSNGMSIALVLNQTVSTVIAAIFLPFVSKYGYATIFFLFAVFTGVYLFTVTVFLPETKGKTLEEIEEYFWRRTPNEPIASK
jgi:SP family myo-inositol transporter-like MFS transporter 13